MSANSTQKSFMPFLMNKKITDSFFFFLPFFHGPALHFAPFSYPPPFLSFQIFISLSRPLATFFFFFFNICFFLLYCFVFLFVLFFKSLFFWWKVDSLIHNCTRGSWHFTFMYAYIFFWFCTVFFYYFILIWSDELWSAFVFFCRFFSLAFSKVRLLFFFIYIYLYFLNLSTWYRMNY